MSWRWTSAAVAALTVGLVLALVASSLAAGSASSVITGGQTLTAGQSLSSPDGHYALTMGPDGNLVETITGGGRTIWSSGTSGHAGADAVLQPGGALVVEDASGNTLWSDNAPLSGGCPALNVLNDGNVEVDGTSAPVWSTGENTGMSDGDYLEPGQVIYSSNYEYYLVMQGDGNLVLYNSSNVALWNAGTDGNPGAYAVLQGDGNFVVYSDASSPVALWNAGTSGNPGDVLDVQSDGNVVVYPASGSYLWDTGTNGAAPGSGSIQPQPQLGSTVACPAAPPPTPTVTVTVATTTVLTVTTSPARTTLPKVKVPVTFDWTWADAYSYLRQIRFGKIPADLHWIATVTPTGKGAKARTYRANTAKQRHALLLALEGQRYTRGERVKIELTRTGYAPETAVFVVRYHRVPELLATK